MLRATWVALAPVALTLMAVPAWAGEKPTTALVRAKVKSVEQVTKTRSTAVLEIVHVYTGPAEWKGRTFADVQQAESLSGREARFPFEMGEEGLWVLTTGKKDELLPTDDDRFLFPRRSRKADNSRYAEHLKLADAVEAVEKSTPGERVKLLVSLADDDTPETGAWAVQVLGESGEPAAAKFLDGFAAKPDAKLSLATQVALDEVLCKTKREEWFESKPRAELLTGWVAGKVDEYHGFLILQRIDTASQRKHIRGSLAVGVVRTAAENKDWPWKARRHAIFLVGMLGGRVVDDDDAFDWLFGQIKTSKDVEVRSPTAVDGQFGGLAPRRR